MNVSFPIENNIKNELDFKDLTSPSKIIFYCYNTFEDEPKKFAEKIENVYKKLIAYKKCRFDRIDEGKEQEFSFSAQERELECLLDTLNLGQYFCPNKGFSITKDPLDMQICIGNSTVFMLSHKGNEEYRANREKFENSMNYFYSKALVQPIRAADGIIESSYREIFMRLLKEYNGLCIGEGSHADSFGKALLSENMKFFKSLEVKTLYLEHLFYDTMNDSLASKSSIPPHIELYLKDLSRGHGLRTKYDFLRLVKKSRKLGIRIVPIDTSLSYSFGSDTNRGVVNLSLRISAMNYTAKRIIERDQKEHPGKYLVFLGAAHLSEFTDQIPGVSELLGIPSILTLESRMKSIQKNISIFQMDNTTHYYSNPVTYCLKGNPRSITEENNTLFFSQDDVESVDKCEIESERKIQKVESIEEIA